MESPVSASHQTILRYDPLIGKSQAVKRLENVISQIASLDTAILIHGESGSGKEMVARMIHHASPRSHKDFHPVHVISGTFVNLEANFKIANNSTLYIDKVGELDQTAQLPLFDLLQHNQNSTTEELSSTTNTRIIAGTRHNLKTLVKLGQFRHDLFYRLNMITLEVPPLRERRDDIPFLAFQFAKMYAKKYNLPDAHLDSATIVKMMNYHWPGNLHELERIIEKIFVTPKIKKVELDEHFFIEPIAQNTSADRQYVETENN